MSVEVFFQGGGVPFSFFCPGTLPYSGSYMAYLDSLHRQLHYPGVGELNELVHGHFIDVTNGDLLQG